MVVSTFWTAAGMGTFLVVLFQRNGEPRGMMRAPNKRRGRGLIRGTEEEVGTGRQRTSSAFRLRFRKLVERRPKQPRRSSPTAPAPARPRDAGSSSTLKRTSERTLPTADGQPAQR